MDRIFHHTALTLAAASAATSISWGMAWKDRGAEEKKQRKLPGKQIHTDFHSLLDPLSMDYREYRYRIRKLTKEFLKKICKYIKTDL